MSGIFLAALVGGASNVITIADVTVSDTSSVSTADARYELQNDGDIAKQEGGAPTDIGDWITPKSNFANYEVRATVSSTSGTGTDTGDVFNSWLGLGTTRGWGLSSLTADGLCSRVLLIEVRDVATSTVQDSANITLATEAQP